MRIRMAPACHIGTDLNQPSDLAAIAESMGVPSERIDDPTRIAPALTQDLHHPGPTLLEIIIGGAV